MYSDSWGYFEAKWGRDYSLDPFEYHFTGEATKAAGAQEAFTVNLASDCWHALVGFRHFSSVAFAAGAALTSEFTLTLTVENRDLQDGPILSYLYGMPVVTPGATLNIAQCYTSLPWPKYIRPGGNIQGVIVHGTVANTIIRLVFDTIKMFAKMPDAEPPLRPRSLRADSIPISQIRV